MIELKRCPFCGGAVRFNHAPTGEPTSVWCNQCHALTIFSRVKTDHTRPFGEIMSEIAEAWNRRTVDVEKQCLSCRYWLGTVCEFRPWATGEVCADWEAKR